MEENKIAHLGMIQGIITRMGANSFSLKGWTIGLIIAIYTFSGASSRNAIILTIIPIIVFWFIDGYYLNLERCYRKLYDFVRKQSTKDIDYNMNYNEVQLPIKEANNLCYLKCVFSKTIWPFYLVCIVITIVIYCDLI